MVDYSKFRRPTPENFWVFKAIVGYLQCETFQETLIKDGRIINVIEEISRQPKV